MSPPRSARTASSARPSPAARWSEQPTLAITRTESYLEGTMKYRTYTGTDLKVSTVGFGLWTLSTGWWGTYTESEAVALMHKAFDLGITLFDAADTYGNGLSEELIAKAFPTRRDDVTVATKIGYDFVTHGETRGRGQREI